MRLRRQIVFPHRVWQLTFVVSCLGLIVCTIGLLGVGPFRRRRGPGEA
jgi:hypothetical protein